MRTIEHVVSRHHPAFVVPALHLGLGRDDKVYLVLGGRTDGQALRLTSDGSEQRFGRVGYGALAITANGDGVIATAEAHLPHRIDFWDEDFNSLGSIDDFTANDTDGFFAPSAVEAAPSGWFYAIDQHRRQVVRLKPGTVDRRVTLTGLDQDATSKKVAVGLRVAEGLGLLYTAWPTAGPGLICVSKLDGTYVRTIKAKPAGPSGFPLGGYDVDDEGRVHVSAGLESEPQRRQVTVYNAQGAYEGTVTLALPEDPYKIHYLRVRNKQYYVKRNDPKYLFEVYDFSGKLVRQAAADVERLAVSYEADQWTAGREMPLTVTHERGRWSDDPRFRVWLRPLGVPEFTELPLTAGTVTPSADARGLYHLRVSPDVAGRIGEYVVDGIVEVRTPESTKGSLSLMTCRVDTNSDGVETFTALNRFSYGRGEPVTVRVVARVADGTPLPVSARVRVLRDGAEVHTENVTLTDGRGRMEIGAERTAALEPGRYVIDAEQLPGFTVAPHHLDLGPGLVRRPDFHITWYSDIYANNHASIPSDPRDVVRNPSTQRLPAFADLPDTVRDHVARAEKLGLNLFVDRLGFQWPRSFKDGPADASVVDRLKKSKIAVHWDKAMFEDPARRTIAGYGARGMEEQAVLYANDTFLPLSWPGNHEEREQPELDGDLLSATGSLHTYAAFRGWTWGANWWVGAIGAAAAETEDERKRYNDALRHVEEPGGWVPVLDTVTDRSIALKAADGARFRSVLNGAFPGKVSAMTAPYRAPQTLPPVLFASADEVDLHYQGEQLQLLGATAHMVDYYRRPGKPAWGHPELFNDDGTGGMILSTLLQQVMRGANGTGMTGDQGAYHLEGITALDDRGAGSGGRPGDPRSAGAGRTSMLRAAFDLSTRLGPTTAAARNADRVAIVVSTRMQRLETSQGLSSTYFLRLFEAYTACLYAHRPATFVFTEDVSADVLRRYDAVLLIGQRTDLDPRLATALAEAGQGPDPVPVFADESCVQRYQDAYRDLGTAFTRVESDPVPQSDDVSYLRLRRVYLDQAAKVAAALKDVVSPVAECDNPEVLLSEWRAGTTTYIWAVNNTLLDWDPSLVWRVGLRCGHRVPVTAKLKVALPALHQVVDVLTGERVGLLGGEFTADLRTVPARLYAVVPLTHDPLPPPAEYAFGPHVRDIAVAADGRTAALTAFNWDHNLYGLDLATGTTRWRRRLGHHFAYTPSASGAGFAAQGFDVHSPEGYHLYLLNADGSPRRRFALFGLPKKATDWSKGGWGHDYGLNNFAAAPGGSWVATSGDLGLALWDVRDGGAGEAREKWAHEWWKTGERTPRRLLALDDDTLITFAADTITGLAAADGATLWSIPTAAGSFGGGVVSGDRSTAVIWSDADGGRVYVIRGGALVSTLPTAASEVSVSADGSFLAVTFRNQLKAYDTARGLLWTYTGDDLLRRPRVSPDGTRVAVGSELGTLAVLRRDGTPLTTKDLKALPVPAWLPDGGLLVATWTGTVLRYTAGLDERWRTRLTPSETDIRPKLLTPDPVPAVRRAGWGNTTATKDLTPNLITTTSALLDVRLVNPTRTVDLAKQNAVALLSDGRADPPANPWVPPTVIGAIRIQDGQELLFTVDTFRTQVELTGVTFAEDPAHPESWLRDVQLQWWDTRAGLWKDGPKLLSDAGAVHSHTFGALSSSRFRLRTTGGGIWPVGNIRLGELVFHGTAMGNSHRDVLDDHVLAVLFDDREDDVRDIVEDSSAADIQIGGAAVGTRCLRLKKAVERYPTARGPYGHAMHDWDFRIVENPSARGEYRHLQFAWKALSSRTSGISARFGPAKSAPIFSASIGDSRWPPQTSMVEKRFTGPVPRDWQVVRVDLWKFTAGAVKVVDQFALRSNGDGALFDQIVLARTEDQLPDLPWPRST